MLDKEELDAYCRATEELVQRLTGAGKVISFVAPAAGIMTLAFNTGSGKTVASTAVRVTPQAGPGPISGTDRKGQ